MVEEEAVDGTVATCYETAGETINVETLYACFTSVPPADKLDVSVWVVRIEIDYLIWL